ncbi:hypothetical protein FOA43_001085 [Brettanomyces nanus]|uniref:Cyclin-like domain-containing protein n=1 Tax=Eeniella nana TaxID=13502 RepID=A0A875RWR5_EENNA|nr:uncharacterized protein FOA43_001085 [Brettanomyces nanus]QPG73771.1 hypothetical protein FOA43_001085 [Brettanomyces nanus]
MNSHETFTSSAYPPSSPKYNPAEYWEGLIDVPAYGWRFTFDQIKRESPSRRITDTSKRIGFTVECQKRAKGIVFMFACCRQLKLSRSVALTASYYYHRFYMRRDFSYYHYFEIAATCLFIACKAEECRRKLADVVKVCASIAMWGKMNDTIDEDSKIYWKWKDTITNLEELLLEVLCFDVTPENAYKVCLRSLDLEFDEEPAKEDEVEKRKSQQIFVICTNFFEILARLPLLLMFDTETICALGTAFSCKQEKRTMKEHFLTQKLNVRVEDVWKCYNTAIELANSLEPLRPSFRVLESLPRLDQEELSGILGVGVKN